jgi:hypothetical protein
MLGQRTKPCLHASHLHVLAAWDGCAGESDPIKKNPEEDPWVRGGTQVGLGLVQRFQVSCRFVPCLLVHEAVM